MTRLAVLDKDTYIKVCKIGQRAACCKYLVGGVAGLECGKPDLSLRRQIDARTDMSAKGDNCPGVRSQ